MKATRSRPSAWTIMILSLAVIGIISLLAALVLRNEKPPVPYVAQGLPEYVDTTQLLPVNPYSRPGDKLTAVNGIVIHYVGNPGTSALQNRNYFAGLAESHATYASANFVIGLDGEILLCVPTDEVAYCSNHRNSDTLSIECCHPDETGAFTEATYRSLVRLASWLCKTYGLTQEQVLRHYDVTGKLCPLYYVEHPDEWDAFRQAVAG
ncbi:MAG: N-acetylmuramoyl-L-alanine amidase [Clostridia bacterium]|nr:N-acetylmuramoyl-L-alanine amidase [Clostridia bacterium]